MCTTRRWLSWVCLASGLALAACAAPAPSTSDAPGAASDAARAAPGSAAAAPQRSAPAPAAPAPVAIETPRTARTPTTGVRLDYSCRVDADCAVKNVGNCCGAMPACVNRDSPTDPAGVQAECARSGLSSVCGFADIAACSCVASRCEAQSAAAPVAQ